MRRSPFKKGAIGIKCGLRKNKSGWVQKYRCTATGKYFTVRDGFEKMKTKPEIIVDALDLRAKGLSLAKISDFLFQKYKQKIGRDTILYWQNKFGEKIQTFTSQFQLEFSENTHADEMFLKKKGAQITEFIYYWAAIDYDTKFLLADHISLWREEEECKTFLKKVKKRIKKPPKYCHTDNSYDYPKPIRAVLKGTVHIHFPAWKKKFKNNPIERYFNTVREVTKNLRKFTNANNMLKHLQFLAVYYNFLRPHKTLCGQTPAQVAGFGTWTWWSLIKKWIIIRFLID